MDDEKYDKYEHKYGSAEVENAQEHFADDEPLSRDEAVDAMEEAGVRGLDEDEHPG